MMTRGKALLPHVLAIPVGSTIEFPNDDPISHNLFSLSSDNAFDLGLYRKGAGKSHKFDTPGVVNVYCNVHPNMSAVIHVMATPYYAFADAARQLRHRRRPGREVPPGGVERAGGTERVDVEVRGRQVTGNWRLTLDSRNYRATQHTDKNGKPYEAPSSKEY